MTTLTDLLGQYAMKELNTLAYESSIDYVDKAISPLRENHLWACETIALSKLDACTDAIKHFEEDNKLEVIDDAIVALVHYRDVLNPIPTLDVSIAVSGDSVKIQKHYQEIVDCERQRQRILASTQGRYYKELTEEIASIKANGDRGTS